MRALRGYCARTAPAKSCRVWSEASRRAACCGLHAACRVRAACCVLRAACRLPRACCIQPKVARCVLPLAACVLHTVARYVLQTACRLPCACCRMHAACCALRDAGALLYSTWYHEHNCMMQICMGTERNGQVGRTYWQAAMRYKVCHVYTCYTPLPVLPRCMLYAASCASVL